ncbi:putative DNA polymerase delta subunit 3 [Rosellinia necatrix]|uniref:DNA polymerase delta subunit 3 n=1 Tax=Rosellinia necatrix TaxID=77044 RepID=A0A1W2TTK1_ROSNE|nr:putative DNA polymerase delta subunit 3 [Rosellinia necatrix]
MEDYKQYLAQKILTEDQVVTYRLLSRALKVHVNVAKEMLYDFHKWQNEKRPGTLHATYVIYGTKSKPVQQDEDVEMTDSQMSDGADAPFSDLVPTYTLSLVTQEQLEESLSQYTDVASIHVYSLAPHPLKDLQLLADAARQVFELSAGDNKTPDSIKVYGTITNPNARRRERRTGPIPMPDLPVRKTESKPPAKEEAKPTTAPAIKEEPRPSFKPAPPSAPTKKPTPGASLKRQESSGIGQMFAKAAAKPKKPAAKPAAPSPAEDKKGTGAMSDDGEDDTEPMADVKREESSARQARKDRQAELHRMMEESDEEEEEEEEEAEEAADSPDEGDPMDEEPPPPEPEPKAEEPAEVVSSAGGGRRRGRRRVMRKKHIKDDKGYLVTIQEQGWESFSEDEAPAPAPPPFKPKPQQQQQQSAKSEPAAKPKKGAAAGKPAQGQGSIMSFFSKK